MRLIAPSCIGLLWGKRMSEFMEELFENLFILVCVFIELFVIAAVHYWLFGTREDLFIKSSVTLLLIDYYNNRRLDTLDR